MAFARKVSPRQRVEVWIVVEVGFGLSLRLVTDSLSEAKQNRGNATSKIERERRERKDAAREYLAAQC
jgi:hypothetical protein